MSSFFKHLGLVNRHRLHVFLNGRKCGIGVHCLFHDLSKYGPTELFTSAKYYDGHHSPVLEERLQNDYFSAICQHHTRRNKHHWEYWTDFFQGNILARAMPWKYATEYVCDMLSASYCYNPKTFSGATAYEYFAARCDHYYLSEVTRRYVLWCLERFRDLGFKGLKKKDTKAHYMALLEKYGPTTIYGQTAHASALPQDAKEFIMPPFRKDVSQK